MFGMVQIGQNQAATWWAYFLLCIKDMLLHYYDIFSIHVLMEYEGGKQSTDGIEWDTNLLVIYVICFALPTATGFWFDFK